MKARTGANASLWTGTPEGLQARALQGSGRAEVCVVGAGMAGLSVAYELARRGRSVVVVDAGTIGGGETSRTSGHLTAALDEPYFELERIHGVERARLAAESHTAAIDAIQRTVRTEGIDCDFRRVMGYLFLAPGEEPDFLSRECAAAQRAGLSVAQVGRVPYVACDLGAALRFARQAHFHPMKYMEGVARAVAARGGRIHTGTRALEIRGGARPEVHTAQGVLSVEAVVVATHAPVDDAVARHTARRTCVIAGSVPAGSVPDVLMWDTLDPYHYVRTQPGDRRRDWLVVGGQDHEVGRQGEVAARFKALEAWARARFPMLREIDWRWSGQVVESADGLGSIGRNPRRDNVYTVAGGSGNGMTHGAMAGLLLADLIEGSVNPWTELYDPARESAAAEYAPENAGVAAQHAGQFLRNKASAGRATVSRERAAAGVGDHYRRESAR